MCYTGTCQYERADGWCKLRDKTCPFEQDYDYEQDLEPKQEEPKSGTRLSTN
uniref:Uncharacterized protein n=1 Tax=viral metagenome TaxID=1070528 RepID=A0A6M3IH56_9ZZZZ